MTGQPLSVSGILSFPLRGSSSCPRKDQPRDRGSCFQSVAEFPVDGHDLSGDAIVRESEEIVPVSS